MGVRLTGMGHTNVAFGQMRSWVWVLGTNPGQARGEK